MTAKRHVHEAIKHSLNSCACPEGGPSDRQAEEESVSQFWYAESVPEANTIIEAGERSEVVEGPGAALRSMGQIGHSDEIVENRSVLPSMGNGLLGAKFV